MFYKKRYLSASGEAALPLPQGEVVRHKPDRRGPSQSKIKDFCQLSHRESQGSSDTDVIYEKIYLFTKGKAKLRDGAK